MTVTVAGDDGYWNNTVAGNDNRYWNDTVAGNDNGYWNNTVAAAIVARRRSCV